MFFFFLPKFLTSPSGEPKYIEVKICLSGPNRTLTSLKQAPKNDVADPTLSSLYLLKCSDCKMPSFY